MIIIFLIILINIIIDKNLVYNSIINSMTIWMYKIYPSFFICYIITYYLLNKGIFKKVSYILHPFISFESNKSYELLLASIFVSNPTILNFSKLCYKNKEININDYQKICYLSIFSNPLFVLIFINYKKYLFFLSIQLLVMFITNKFFPLKNMNYNENKNKENSLIILSSSLNQVISILLMVLSSICFINLIKDSILNLLSIDKMYLFILEISSGSIDIINSSLSNLFKESLLLFLFTFQGIAINLQNYLTVKNEIQFKKVIIIRLIQSMITSIIYFSFLYIAYS